MVIKIVIITSLGIFFSETCTTTSESLTLNYVTPSKTTPCPSEQRPCLTLKEYASQPDVYFVNNTVLCFHPGTHELGDSLRLKNVYNFSFEGLPTDNGVLVNIEFYSLASITWEKSWNINISSITFILRDNFTFIIRFELSLFVHLSNISIVGNGYSGCSSIMSRESTLDITNSMFNRVKGLFGAALMMLASNIIFSGTNNFVNNTATFGGSVYLSDSNLTLNGANLFLNNTSLRDDQKDTTVINKSVCDHSMEATDTPLGSGGAIYCNVSYLRIYGHSSFTGNVAESVGGAIDMESGHFTFQGNISFSWNRAYNFGGSINYWNSDGQFIGTAYFNENYDSAIMSENSNITFIGTSYFYRNTGFEGGAIQSHFSNVTFSGTAYFDRNKVYKGGYFSGGAIQTYFGNVLFSGTVHFERNVADIGGAIHIYDSNLMFSGTVYFDRNKAYKGGAMLLEGTSKLILKPKLNISFILNHAVDSGGALYFRDSQCSLGTTKLDCFIIIDGPLASISNVSLHFVNNSAGSTGSVLYGGQFDKCRLFFKSNSNSNISACNTHNTYSDAALQVLIAMSTIVEHAHNESANISSYAEKIWVCPLQGDESYSRSSITLSVYPGQQFNITVIALGQAGFPVPSKLLSEQRYIDDEYRLSPSNHNINDTCNNVSFRLYSAVDDDYVCIKLYPENPCQNLVNYSLELAIAILPCPLGFELSKDDHKCVCSKKVKKFIQNCYIDDVSFERIRNNFWISKANSTVLIIHDFRCPLDYCKDNSTNLSLSNPSAQCDFNRTGTLCGQCQKNFSLALGSLHCIPSDNNHAALIVLFALAGVALILIIYLFRLTVSVGTLNGLFFYTNIIQANNQAFFPRDTINFFTVFISVLNLDFGIETCFYDGMDIYAYSWFQFIFPFYIWFLIGCIIVACRYSQSIAKQLGQNPVAVLATLLLMSFSKILQAIIVPLSLTCLTYYNFTSEFESHQIVWLYDGSIQFFKKPKHIVLGVFAVFSLVVFVVPYIFLLLFGHWLQGCSNWWILSWLNKIKPFMDAYHAPYKKHTRYWTGLLLLSRLGLFLTFAINANGSERINILAVSSVTVALSAIKFRVYEHFYNDILESSFILNLGIFSIATFYLKEESEDAKSQYILSSISVGIAFATFIGILLYHACLVLKSSSIWKVHMLPFIQKSLLLSTILRITPVKDETSAGDRKNTELLALPTSTEIDVDLREPLLEITESHAAANN